MSYVLIRRYTYNTTAGAAERLASVHSLSEEVNSFNFSRYPKSHVTLIAIV